MQGCGYSAAGGSGERPGNTTTKAIEFGLKVVPGAAFFADDPSSGESGVKYMNCLSKYFYQPSTFPTKFPIRRKGLVLSLECEVGEICLSVTGSVIDNVGRAHGKSPPQ